MGRTKRGVGGMSSVWVGFGGWVGLRGAGEVRWGGCTSSFSGCHHVQRLNSSADALALSMV